MSRFWVPVEQTFFIEKLHWFLRKVGNARIVLLNKIHCSQSFKVLLRKETTSANEGTFTTGPKLQSTQRVLPFV